MADTIVSQSDERYEAILAEVPSGFRSWARLAPLNEAHLQRQERSDFTCYSFTKPLTSYSAQRNCLRSHFYSVFGEIRIYFRIRSDSCRGYYVSLQLGEGETCVTVCWAAVACASVGKLASSRTRGAQFSVANI